ncbi:MAG: tRNA pseudouridine(38-40) synthase TruA [Verrucomicrobia bacterium]|nr:tRNA pseudouridine(38-40) synthase TruA [Verrucomicrobiota bacterium]
MKPGRARPVTPLPAPEIQAPDHVRLRLCIAYQGTRFAGWQTQAGQLTVQETVEQALERLFAHRPHVYSSSRTDTGVHALGMVAHVDIPRSVLRMPPAKLVLAANAWLPEDVRILAAARTRPDFHARYGARGKQYRYCVWNHPAHEPLERHRTWHVPRALDVDRMRAAAHALVGSHDFLAFSASPGYARRHTVRHVTRCEVRTSGPLLTLVIEADGFLYKMCRGIAGTLVQVGLGRFAPEALPAMLASRDRRLAGMTAPAHGLVLWKVYYGRRRTRDLPTVESPADLE